MPEAGSRPALARPLPGPAASPGKDQGTGAAGDVSLGTPFASADAVAAVRNEAKDKVRTFNRPRYRWQVIVSTYRKEASAVVDSARDLAHL